MIAGSWRSRVELWMLAKRSLMRKMQILSFTIVLLAAGTTHAQTKMALGLALGGSYNTHTGSVLEKTASGVGLVGGGQIDLSFTKSLGLLTTIYVYDNRLGKSTYALTEGGIDYSLDASVTVAYAGVEPLLKFTFPDIRFYIVAGPNIGFKVEGQSVVNATITTPGYSFSNGYASQTTKSDLADVNTRFELSLGGGYVFAIDKQSRLTTQVSVAYGLNTIQKSVDWHISSIKLIAGLEFDVFQ